MDICISIFRSKCYQLPLNSTTFSIFVICPEFGRECWTPFQMLYVMRRIWCFYGNMSVVASLLTGKKDCEIYLDFILKSSWLVTGLQKCSRGSNSLYKILLSSLDTLELNHQTTQYQITIYCIKITCTYRNGIAKLYSIKINIQYSVLLYYNVPWMT